MRRGGIKMAIVPIEIICVGHNDITLIENAVSLLNKQQDLFNFSHLQNDECESYLGESEERYISKEIYNLFDRVIKKLRGYHPHVVGVVNRPLDGKTLGNLFGSMEESDDKLLTGKAITSLWGVKQILKLIPLEVYLIFKFLSFAIRFVVGRGLIHDERRICVFDKKIYKPEIIEVMKSGKLCEICYKRISRLLDSDQLIAIEHIIRIISDICNAENSEASFENQMRIAEGRVPKIFLSHSGADKDFVEKLANDLVDNGCRVWFDKWEIKVGDNIVDQINSGISESDCLALIISRSSVESPWVMNEWTSMFVRATNEKKAKILPILVEDCKVPPIITPYKYADFRDPNNYKLSFEELLKAVKENQPQVITNV
jgi:hypothetical protein